MQHESFLTCPYCWQQISILVDTSVLDQQYVEDCEVCCRPITFTVRCTPDGEVSVDAASTDDIPC